MSKKKIAWPFLRNEYCKNVKIQTKKVNKLFTNIPTANITEQKELIYAGEKQVRDKIGVPQRNTFKNTKPGWENRQEGLINSNNKRNC